MTTLELCEEMRAMAIKLELLSLEMRDLSDGEDALFAHSCEVHGASLMMKTWAKEVILK
jgi:hypothetical protein